MSARITQTWGFLGEETQGSPECQCLGSKFGGRLESLGG